VDQAVADPPPQGRRKVGRPAATDGQRLNVNRIVDQTPEPRSTLPRNVKVLSVASLVNDVASEMIFPLLPGFLLTTLGGNKFFLGIIEGLADSAASILKLWSGAWSDRAGGRKPFVVFGYSLAALARPLIGVTTAPWHVLLIRLSDRIGKGVRTSPRDALIADSCDPQIRGRAFGFHRGMDHLGAAIGPLLAAVFLWLWPDAMRTMFTLTLIPGVIVAAVVIFGLREVASSKESPLPQREGQGESEPHSTAQQPSSLPKGEGATRTLRLSLAPIDRNFRLYLLALVVFTLGNSSDAFLLVRVGELGVPQFALPLLCCAFHVLKSSGNVVCGRAVDKFGPRPFVFIGWGVYAAVYLAFAFATTAWQAAAVFLAYGWYNFSIGAATLPSSLIFGAFYERIGALAAFGTGAGLAAVATVLLLSVQPTARS
jgi:MFS family permease